MPATETQHEVKDGGGGLTATVRDMAASVAACSTVDVRCSPNAASGSMLRQGEPGVEVPGRSDERGPSVAHACSAAEMVDNFVDKAISSHAARRYVDGAHHAGEGSRDELDASRPGSSP